MNSILTVTTAADTYDLTKVATVKAELGILDRSEDENLARWISQASGAIADHCRRVFAQETVTEVFRPGRCLEDLVLARYPVSAVASVVEDGVTLATTDYEISAASGILTRLYNDQPCTWTARKITVVYTAGYASIADLPDAIERACVTLVRQYRHATDRDPMVRSESVENLGDVSYFSGGATGLSAEVIGMLAPHRNRKVG